MPLSVPEGFGVLAYRFALASDPEVMVTTVGIDMTGVVATPQDITDEKADAFATAVPAGDLAGGYTFLGCVLRLSEGGGSSVLYEAPRNIIGTAEDVSIPNNCAYLVHKNTSRGGRRGRGRMYLPPYIVAEADVNPNGVLSPAALTGLQSVVDDAFPLAHMVLLHDSVPEVITPDAITSLVVDRQIATQRRRMR